MNKYVLIAAAVFAAYYAVHVDFGGVRKYVVPA